MANTLAQKPSSVAVKKKAQELNFERDDFTNWNKLKKRLYEIHSDSKQSMKKIELVKEINLKKMSIVNTTGISAVSSGAFTSALSITAAVPSDDKKDAERRQMKILAAIKLFQHNDALRYIEKKSRYYRYLNYKYIIDSEVERTQLIEYKLRGSIIKTAIPFIITGVGVMGVVAFNFLFITSITSSGLWINLCTYMFNSKASFISITQILSNFGLFDSGELLVLKQLYEKMRLLKNTPGLVFSSGDLLNLLNHVFLGHALPENLKTEQMKPFVDFYSYIFKCIDSRNIFKKTAVTDADTSIENKWIIYIQSLYGSPQLKFGLGMFKIAFSIKGFVDTSIEKMNKYPNSDAVIIFKDVTTEILKSMTVNESIFEISNLITGVPSYMLEKINTDYVNNILSSIGLQPDNLEVVTKKIFDDKLVGYQNELKKIAPELANIKDVLSVVTNNIAEIQKSTSTLDSAKKMLANLFETKKNIDCIKTNIVETINFKKVKDVNDIYFKIQGCLKKEEDKLNKKIADLETLKLDGGVILELCKQLKGINDKITQKSEIVSPVTATTAKVAEAITTGPTTSADVVVNGTVTKLADDVKAVLGEPLVVISETLEQLNIEKKILEDNIKKLVKVDETKNKPEPGIIRLFVDEFVSKESIALNIHKGIHIGLQKQVDLFFESSIDKKDQNNILKEVESNKDPIKLIEEDIYKRSMGKKKGLTSQQITEMLNPEKAKKISDIQFKSLPGKFVGIFYNNFNKLLYDPEFILNSLYACFSLHNLLSVAFSSKFIWGIIHGGGIYVSQYVTNKNKSGFYSKDYGFDPFKIKEDDYTVGVIGKTLINELLMKKRSMVDFLTLYINWFYGNDNAINANFRKLRTAFISDLIDDIDVIFRDLSSLVFNSKSAESIYDYTEKILGTWSLSLFSAIAKGIYKFNIPIIKQKMGKKLPNPDLNILKVINDPKMFGNFCQFINAKIYNVVRRLSNYEVGNVLYELKDFVDYDKILLVDYKVFLNTEKYFEIEKFKYNYELLKGNIISLSDSVTSEVTQYMIVYGDVDSFKLLPMNAINNELLKKISREEGVTGTQEDIITNSLFLHYRKEFQKQNPQFKDYESEFKGFLINEAARVYQNAKPNFILYGYLNKLIVKLKDDAIVIADEKKYTDAFIQNVIGSITKIQITAANIDSFLKNPTLHQNGLLNSKNVITMSLKEIFENANIKFTFFTPYYDVYTKKFNYNTNTFKFSDCLSVFQILALSLNNDEKSQSVRDKLVFIESSINKLNNPELNKKLFDFRTKYITHLEGLMKVRNNFETTFTDMVGKNLISFDMLKLDNGLFKNLFLENILHITRPEQLNKFKGSLLPASCKNNESGQLVCADTKDQKYIKYVERVNDFYYSSGKKITSEEDFFNAVLNPTVLMVILDNNPDSSYASQLKTEENERLNFLRTQEKKRVALKEYIEKSLSEINADFIYSYKPFGKTEVVKETTKNTNIDTAVKSVRQKINDIETKYREADSDSREYPYYHEFSKENIKEYNLLIQKYKKMFEILNPLINSPSLEWFMNGLDPKTHEYIIAIYKNLKNKIKGFTSENDCVEVTEYPVPDYSKLANCFIRIENMFTTTHYMSGDEETADINSLLSDAQDFFERTANVIGTATKNSSKEIETEEDSILNNPFSKIREELKREIVTSIIPETPEDETPKKESNIIDNFIDAVKTTAKIVEKIVEPPKEHEAKPQGISPEVAAQIQSDMAGIETPKKTELITRKEIVELISATIKQQKQNIESQAQQKAAESGEPKITTPLTFEQEALFKFDTLLESILECDHIHDSSYEVLYKYLSKDASVMTNVEKSILHNFRKIVESDLEEDRRISKNCANIENDTNTKQNITDYLGKNVFNKFINQNNSSLQNLNLVDLNMLEPGKYEDNINPIFNFESSLISTKEQLILNIKNNKFTNQEICDYLETFIKNKILWRNAQLELLKQYSYSDFITRMDDVNKRYQQFTDESAKLLVQFAVDTQILFDTVSVLNLGNILNNDTKTPLTPIGTGEETGTPPTIGEAKGPETGGPTYTGPNLVRGQEYQEIQETKEVNIYEKGRETVDISKEAPVTTSAVIKTDEQLAEEAQAQSLKKAEKQAEELRKKETEKLDKSQAQAQKEALTEKLKFGLDQMSSLVLGLLNGISSFLSTKLNENNVPIDINTKLNDKLTERTKYELQSSYEVCKKINKQWRYKGSNIDIDVGVDDTLAKSCAKANYIMTFSSWIYYFLTSSINVTGGIILGGINAVCLGVAYFVPGLVYKCGLLGTMSTLAPCLSELTNNVLLKVLTKYDATYRNQKNEKEVLGTPQHNIMTKIAKVYLLHSQKHINDEQKKTNTGLCKKAIDIFNNLDINDGILSLLNFEKDEIYKVDHPDYDLNNLKETNLYGYINIGYENGNEPGTVFDMVKIFESFNTLVTDDEKTLVNTFFKSYKTDKSQINCSDYKQLNIIQLMYGSLTNDGEIFPVNHFKNYFNCKITDSLEFSFASYARSLIDGSLVDFFISEVAFTLSTLFQIKIFRDYILTQLLGNPTQKDNPTDKNFARDMVDDYLNKLDLKATTSTKNFRELLNEEIITGLHKLLDDCYYEFQKIYSLLTGEPIPVAELPNLTSWVTINKSASGISALNDDDLVKFKGELYINIVNVLNNIELIENEEIKNLVTKLKTELVCPETNKTQLDCLEDGTMLLKDFNSIILDLTQLKVLVAKSENVNDATKRNEFSNYLEQITTMLNGLRKSFSQKKSLQKMAQNTFSNPETKYSPGLMNYFEYLFKNGLTIEDMEKKPDPNPEIKIDICSDGFKAVFVENVAICVEKKIVPVKFTLEDEYYDKQVMAYSLEKLKKGEIDINDFLILNSKIDDNIIYQKDENVIFKILKENLDRIRRVNPDHPVLKNETLYDSNFSEPIKMSVKTIIDTKFKKKYINDTKFEYVENLIKQIKETIPQTENDKQLLLWLFIKKYDLDSVYSINMGQLLLALIQLESNDPDITFANNYVSEYESTHPNVDLDNPENKKDLIREYVKSIFGGDIIEIINNPENKAKLFQYLKYRVTQNKKEIEYYLYKTKLNQFDNQLKMIIGGIPKTITQQLSSANLGKRTSYIELFQPYYTKNIYGKVLPESEDEIKELKSVFNPLDFFQPEKAGKKDPHQPNQYRSYSLLNNQFELTSERTKQLPSFAKIPHESSSYKELVENRDKTKTPKINPVLDFIDDFYKEFIFDDNCDPIQSDIQAERNKRDYSILVSKSSIGMGKQSFQDFDELNLAKAICLDSDVYSLKGATYSLGLSKNSGNAENIRRYYDSLNLNYDNIPQIKQINEYTNFLQFKQYFVEQYVPLDMFTDLRVLTYWNVNEGKMSNFIDPDVLEPYREFNIDRPTYKSETIKTVSYKERSSNAVKNTWEKYKPSWKLW